jgi:pimeloyl-ACP methyl ester carboxylesterase
VYAVDILGDVGKSVAKSPPRNKAEHCEWLLEVMEGLDVDRAHLVGISYGALLALNFALHLASRVDRLVLMSPAFLIAPFTGRWIATSARIAAFPSRSTILKVLDELSMRGFAGDEPMLRQRVLAMKGKRTRRIVFPAFSRRRLRELRAPSLVLFGAAEIMYDPRRALAAAKQLIPGARAAIIPNGGHSLNRDQPEIVNRLIPEFLDSPLSRGES